MKVSLIEENESTTGSEIKNILKKAGIKIAKKLVIITLPIVIVLLLISAITWFIFRDQGTWDNNEKGNPSTYTKNVTLSPTAGISTDKMQLVKQCLSDMGYSDERISSMEESEIIEILQMKTKLKKNVRSIESCTVAEILWCVNDDYSKHLNKAEDLETLLNAELITQYPKIDGVPADKLNGIIQFARVDKDNDSDADGDIDIDDNLQMLTYIEPTEFDTKFNNYITSGNKDVFNYFTLDNQENAVIATWSEETGSFESNNTTLQTQQKIKPGHTQSSIQSEYDSRYAVTVNSKDSITASYVTYTATKQTINYKANMQKYTLTFEYLWSLLVMGESDDFVLNLAQLAYDSQIIIGIYDIMSESVQTETYVYTENFRERYEEYHDGYCVISTNWTNPPEAYSYQDTNIITNLDNTVQYDLMYANTWIVEIKTRYKNVQTPGGYAPGASGSADEEWVDNGSYTNSWVDVDVNKDVDPDTGEEIVTTTRTSIREVYFKEKRTIGKSFNEVQNAVHDGYEKVEIQIREKTDIDPSTDNNFVKILRADTNASTMLFKPINVLWLNDILKINDDTVNMVELTQYLINKAKNPEDTSLMFDFSVFGANTFNEMSNALNLSRYLRQFSHSGEAPKSADGNYYKMYGDGEGWPTIGNADLQWKSHYSKFAKAGKVLKDGNETEVTDVAAYVNSLLTRGAAAEYTDQEVDSYNIYIDVELVDDIGDSVQNTYYQLVRNSADGLNLSRQQLYGLTAIAYNFGHLPQRNGYTFKSAYESGLALYEADSVEHIKFIWDNWWAHIGGGSPGHIPARDAAFETYVKGIFDFSKSDAGTVFARKYYIYYTQEQLNQFSYAPNKTVTRTSSNETEIFKYVQIAGDGILATAEDFHKKMEDEKWTYSLHGLYYNDIESSINHPNKLTCCATYVSSVLYLSGYATESEMNTAGYNSSVGLYNYMKSRGDCIEITSYSELQAGDIVFMKGTEGKGIGHVQICAGDNQWYNAGSTDAIRRASPYTDTSYARAKFITALRIR